MAFNGSVPVTLEAIHCDCVNEDDEDVVPTDQTSLRLFTSIDEIRASVAAITADVARTQGSQKAMEGHMDTMRAAIGDVTQTKIEAARTAEKITNVEKDVLEMKTTLADAAARAETKSWVEPLVRWAVTALVGGSAIGVGAAAAQKVLQ